MKTLDLNNYGVQEMNTVEMKENSGGWLLSLVTVYILLEAACNPGTHASAFRAGWNAA